ncbi:MAG: heat shock protein transcriptional repressor HspR [Candidatus Nanopelagicales bacterium]
MIMRRRDIPDVDVDAAVYGISVAAQIANLHPQTLRQYDRLGLVSPSRTQGRTRLYSLRDIARLKEVSELTAEGVNLAGIQRIMQLEEENLRLRRRIDELTQRSSSTAVVVWRDQRRTR